MVVLSGTAPESSRYLRKEFINLLAFFKLQNQNLIDEVICNDIANSYTDNLNNTRMGESLNN